MNDNDNDNDKINEILLDFSEGVNIAKHINRINRIGQKEIRNLEEMNISISKVLNALLVSSTSNMIIAYMKKLNKMISTLYPCKKSSIKFIFNNYKKKYLNDLEIGLRDIKFVLTDLERSKRILGFDNQSHLVNKKEMEFIYNSLSEKFVCLNTIEDYLLKNNLIASSDLILNVTKERSSILSQCLEICHMCIAAITLVINSNNNMINDVESILNKFSFTILAVRNQVHLYPKTSKAFSNYIIAKFDDVVELIETMIKSRDATYITLTNSINSYRSKLIRMPIMNGDSPLNNIIFLNCKNTL